MYYIEQSTDRYKVFKVELDIEKIKILKLKLQLKCERIITHTEINTELIINEGFIKNIKSSLIIDKDNQLIDINGKYLRRFEYDEYTKSSLVIAIEKLLNGSSTALDELREYKPNQNELAYYQEVLDCIKLEEIDIHNSKVKRRKYGK